MLSITHCCADNTKAEAASKKPEEPARAQASRTKRGQTEQEHAPSDRPTETGQISGLAPCPVRNMLPTLVLPPQSMESAVLDSQL